jgi:hypothetical protein
LIQKKPEAVQEHNGQAHAMPRPPQAGDLIPCAAEGCSHSIPFEVISGAWAHGNEFGVRFCPEHSDGAVTIPNPHDLTAPERFSIAANGQDPGDFIGIDLGGAVSVDMTPRGYVITMQGPMPVILKQLKKTSRLLGPDGQPQVERAPFALPPHMRLVVPRSALTDEARASLEAGLANPQKWKRSQ